MSGAITVFQRGKGTLTTLEWVSGKGRHTITKSGAGQFLDRPFDSVTDAKQFCETELSQDQSAIFYIVQNDLILETVLDGEFHRIEARKDCIRGSMFSLVIVAILSWLVFVKGVPFQSSTTNLLLAGGMTLLYILILWSNNWNGIESMVAIGLFLLFAYLSIGAIQKTRRLREQPAHTFHEHQNRYNPRRLHGLHNACCPHGIINSRG